MEQLRELIRGAPPKSLIARGLGRSYGDAASQSSTVIELPAFDRIELDSTRGTCTAGAGVSLDQILKVIVPAGFFLPVTPGTRNVTVGGAIAADVHGKNHHVDGSFGNHVQRLLLVDGNGDLRELTPSGRGSFDEAEFFWATVGGMGLTGVIVEATFTLIPITSSLISVDTTRYRDLESLMVAMVEADSRYRYSVAWVDSLDPKGRGVLTCGDHAPAEALPKDKQADPLYYDPKALASAPISAWWAVEQIDGSGLQRSLVSEAPKQRVGELQEITFLSSAGWCSGLESNLWPSWFPAISVRCTRRCRCLVPRIRLIFESWRSGFLTVLKRLVIATPSLSFPGAWMDFGCRRFGSSSRTA